jgi:hypothetical protein
MLYENGLDRFAAFSGIDSRMHFEHARDLFVERDGDLTEWTHRVYDLARGDAEECRRAGGMQPHAERADVRWISHLDRRVEGPTTVLVGWLPLNAGPASVTAPPKLNTIST